MMRRDWSWLNEETASEHYLEYFEGMGRTELHKEDGGFYQALQKRDLVHILPESKQRDWSWLNDEENLEESIQNYITENGLECLTRTQIRKEDSLFYQSLVYRRLLDYLPNIKPSDQSMVRVDKE